MKILRAFLHAYLLWSFLLFFPLPASATIADSGNVCDGDFALATPSPPFANSGRGQPYTFSCRYLVEDGEAGDTEAAEFDFLAEGMGGMPDEVKIVLASAEDCTGTYAVTVTTYSVSGPPSGVTETVIGILNENTTELIEVEKKAQRFIKASELAAMDGCDAGDDDQGLSVLVIGKNREEPTE